MQKKYHRHIDNGGVSFNVKTEDGIYSAEIEIQTAYYGYPAVKASLSGLNKKDLREIGQMLLCFAADMA